MHSGSPEGLPLVENLAFVQGETMKYRMAFLVALQCGSFSLVHAAAPAKPQQRQIDPRADRLLHGMSDYLAGLKSFRVDSMAVDEVVLTSGQKLQFVRDSRVSVM